MVEMDIRCAKIGFVGFISSHRDLGAELLFEDEDSKHN